jgi:hypothetical protein
MIYSCFDILDRGRRTYLRESGVSGPLQPTVGLELWQFSRPILPGPRAPVDGCDVRGNYGHRWPGKLGYHSVIEVPFTEAGRRFFEDRAAARDVSFFLRQTQMRRLRRTSAHLSAENVRRAFGSSIAALPSREARPPAGRIGYWADRSGLLLRRISSTGHRFEVVIGQKGGVIKENLDPYAAAFDRR